MSEDTYSMGYKCWNCGREFQRSVRKGEKALGNAGRCPVCEMNDDYVNDVYHEPLR